MVKYTDGIGDVSNRTPVNFHCVPSGCASVAIRADIVIIPIIFNVYISLFHESDLAAL